MIEISAALLDLKANNRSCLRADLYTFELVGGTVLRYTSAGVDLAWNGQTFSRCVLSRGGIHIVVGCEVDSLKVNLSPPAGAVINGRPWLAAADLGALDEARVTLERVYLASWQQPPVGTVVLFTGQVGPVEGDQLGTYLEIKSDLNVLNRKVPINLYQPGCLYTLYSQDCGLNKADWAEPGEVAAGSSESLILCALAQAAGYFDLGVLRFTSGAHAGTARTIQAYTPGQIALVEPLVSPPAPADSFTAWPGCDKAQATCGAKFNNYVTVAGNPVLRFRGMPYVPKPDTAL